VTYFRQIVAKTLGHSIEEECADYGVIMPVILEM